MAEKYGNVTNTLFYLQTVAELVTTAVTVLRNCCNSVNKRTYTDSKE
jgi:hypothetical protein